MAWKSSLTLLCGCLAVAAGCSGHATGTAPPGRMDHSTLIQPSGAIGGIAPGDLRSQVEARLGRGRPTRPVFGHAARGRSWVAYPSSRLVIMYVRRRDGHQVAWAIETRSDRYHTADGLSVGSSLAAARHTRGIRCEPQLGETFSCQGGLGYEKPVTDFDVRHGRVERVLVVAVAD